MSEKGTRTKEIKSAACLPPITPIRQTSNLKSKSESNSKTNKKSCESTCKGHIVSFRNVSLQYKGLPKIVRNLTFEIDRFEKIGIIGSRDSGKTALVLALYRLTELTEGCIKIDGVDISKVDPHVIQKRMKIIHQDPIILSGSLRANLDPFREFEDTYLINALDRVGLSNKLINGKASNLDVELQTNCLSIPEKQLILIASSFLHKPKILIVQEAQESWAGGDAMKLSKSLQVIETVCREFPACTILLFINQPQALKLCSKVLFMEKGKVAEQGEPQSLMRMQSSKLYQFMAKKFNWKV
ncbi:hypothetical protein LSTR_LSTR005296 [Laodelphax striatellus]|uniref:ABC transporter domain-containing protein n=1 Tax=Laodelphax striatellus TaxID=195883 RepID=A0A482X7S6_LAOST|nr:hypothetical protein LSTR_LSTR005296 [Laodelphax striatellus]